jgi:hypothetical protein
VRRAALIAVALAFAAAACTKNNAASTTTPSTPKTTDTLTGTVAVKGSDFKPFTVTTAGEVDVTLTAAGPPSTIVMGVGIGQIGSGICVPLAGASQPTAAGTSPQVTGVLTPATYCVVVSDVGFQTAPVSYTVTVTHP